ncbi:MAG: nitrate- and nitrite sensing domain-containing protein [Pseudonocardia sp.]|nr:nitrate- and nitrite sensing domain-containing protein [Pseudonocardia sp.]
MTSTETGSSWSDRLSPRNWPLGWKLVAVGLVPALLALVLGVLRVADQAHAASQLETANELLEVRTRVAAAADALRVERDKATLLVAERRLGDRGPLQDAVAQTDGAVEQARAGLAGATNDLDPTVRAALQDAEGGLAQLQVLRTDVGGPAQADSRQIIGRYTGVISRTDLLARALLQQVSTPGVTGLTDALTAVGAASEALTRQHTVLGAALRTGRVTADDRAAVDATDDAFTTAYSSFLLAMGPTQAPVDFIASPENTRRETVKTAILNVPEAGPIPVTVAQWDDASRAATAQVDAAGANIGAELAAAGDAAARRSSNLAGLNSVALMLGLLLAATIVVLVSRSLTRSLRVLRTSALDVAQRRLPQAVENMRSGGTPDVQVEPVPLHTRDEVGQVARAFDTVHGQALKLAADQAALQSNVSSMFVNLSRRSQALVERQLQLIEQLESNEQDPDQLSNLFQLDHLATRMRRNSENLLVLAGTDLTKRNVAPVPLVDVLRAAVSEIEQYQRIVVQAPPQATVGGRATSDVIHLLAELLDNATNFSPPDSQVVMSSLRAQDGSIVVEIADSGVGMLDHELTDANRRLNTPSAVDVSASRRMGLFVVGRLGARHGITVHLGGAPVGGPGGGVTASVTLPAHLVTVSGETESGPAPRSAQLGDAPAQLGVLSSPNGVPPQRASVADRPVPRVTLAPPDGRPADRPTGLNGLPIRTPGSALNRGYAPQPGQVANGVAGEHVATGPGSEADAALPDAGLLRPGSDSERVAAADGYHDADGEPAGAEVGGGAEADHAAAPTEAVPITAVAGPAGTDEHVDADTAADRPDDGERTDGGDAAADRTADRTADRSAGHLAELQLARRTGAAVDAPAASDVPDAPVESGVDASPVRPDPDVVEGTDDTDDTGDTPAAADPAAAPLDEAQAPATGSVPPSTAHPAAGPDGPEAGRPDDRSAEPVADDDVAAQAAAEPAPDTATGKAAPPPPIGDGGRARGAGIRPRPSPRPLPPTGPTGPYRDRPAPATPYAAQPDATGQNGRSHGAVPDVPAAADSPQTGPNTTPLPILAETAGSWDDRAQDDRVTGDGTDHAVASPFGLDEPSTFGLDDPSSFGLGEPAPAGPTAGDDLFAANVPAISEPEGLPRSRRPIAVARRGPADMTETTPIFAEIASAWFASDRPVPVDWELDERPDDDLLPVSAPVPPAGPGLLDGPTRPAPAPAPAPAPDPAGHSFASTADEGWRAASGATAERPDELTAAGLPKRRPRARLVPGSAGSAVLAGPASPTRSADSVRGRLASYQQGVRQGREIRLRRDPVRSGSQPESPGDDTAGPDNGGHDEESR